MDTVTLYFKDERSDKVYQCWIDRNEQLYDVKFAYGRRGGTLTSGTKNSAPLELVDAAKLMAALVREKQGKGYTTGETGAAYMATTNADRCTGILPMLLNPIEEEDLPKYINDGKWIAQEKYDGVRMQLRKNPDGTADAINRKGLLVGAPEVILAAVRNLPGTFILDGECVGETYYAFDLRSTKPLWDRLHDLYLLLNRTGTMPILAVQSWYYHEKVRFLDELRKKNAEGIVLKHLDSLYSSGRPGAGGPALKFKFKGRVTCMVRHVNAKRSVSLDVTDGRGEFVCVGNVTIPANHEIPHEGDIVDIEYLYAFKGGSLVQPVYKGHRDDVLVDDVTKLKYKAGEDNDEG